MGLGPRKYVSRNFGNKIFEVINLRNIAQTIFSVNYYLLRVQTESWHLIQKNWFYFYFCSVPVSLPLRWTRPAVCRSEVWWNLIIYFFSGKNRFFDGFYHGYPNRVKVQSSTKKLGFFTLSRLAVFWGSLVRGKHRESKLESFSFTLHVGTAANSQ